MHVKFISVASHSWKMALSFTSAVRDKGMKGTVWQCLNAELCPGDGEYKRAWSARLCWVYPFLNVALPFTVASPRVGERALHKCVCVSVRADVGVCLPVCVCASAWAFSTGLSSICFAVSGWPRDRCGWPAFSKTRMSETFGCVLWCVFVSCAGDRVESWISEATGRTREREAAKHWHYPVGKKKKAEISEKMSTSDGCGGENVSQIGALVVQMEKTRKENFYRWWISLTCLMLLKCFSSVLLLLSCHLCYLNYGGISVWLLVWAKLLFVFMFYVSSPFFSAPPAHFIWGALKLISLFSWSVKCFKTLREEAEGAKSNFTQT